MVYSDDHQFYVTCLPGIYLIRLVELSLEDWVAKSRGHWNRELLVRLTLPSSCRYRPTFTACYSPYGAYIQYLRKSQDLWSLHSDSAC